VTPRNAVGPALAVVLLIGVVIALYFSVREKRAADVTARRSATRITVRVLSGSEKEKFLADPGLAKILDEEGMSLSVEKAGSREIATRPDLKTFDVAYPAGAPAAVKIAQTTGAKRIFTSFYTPIAVASWKPLLPVLEQSGLVQAKDGSYAIDMDKLVQLMEKGTRWKDLPGNTAYSVGKSVLVTSTDVRRSNSGGMYLALVSYIANGNNVVDNDAAADTIGERMAGLFSRQGFQESSSAGPFEDYVAMGIGKAPLVLVYEQQFLEYALARQTVNPDMVLLYPAPTILSKHTLVALTDNGARFAQLMTTSEKVSSIAQHYGFRSQDNTQLFSLAQARNLVVPHTVVDVIDPPSFDMLERLIGRVDAALSK